MHEDPTVFQGISTKLHAETISSLIAKFEAKSLLDYGCGKGHQYKKDNLHIKYFNGVMPALYDIGVPEFDELPTGKFDGVISTDVLEHIPESQLDEVLKEIYNKATKFVYLGICDKLAIKTLPNGENAHCTVHPIEWWMDKIYPFAKVYTVINTYGTADKTITIER